MDTNECPIMIDTPTTTTTTCGDETFSSDIASQNFVTNLFFEFYTCDSTHHQSVSQ